MRKKRKSRELALQTLYALEMGAGGNPDEVLESIAQTKLYGQTVIDYARELVATTLDKREEADGRIRRHAANWELKRMAAIDRNILRLAITELTHFAQIPPKVVIDEAVEIAKSYSTEESSRFVNGVIDAAYKQLCLEKADT